MTVNRFLLLRHIRNRTHTCQRHSGAPRRREQELPITRLGRPEELADLICFLASESAGYITGASFDINGGSLMI
ncbi:MAG: hypothetical protein DMF74_12440 [Acidobacteria bacterium]|nr:MAG: hypothetical protein DMF74_12440 [Acidobacteriota bacterium]